MGYYNYHARIKARIKSREKFSAVIADEYHSIAPALIIVFADKTYPIREYRFAEYLELIAGAGVSIVDKRNK